MVESLSSLSVTTIESAVQIIIPLITPIANSAERYRSRLPSSDHIIYESWRKIVLGR